MGLNSTSRVVLAAGLILTALMLHVGLCVWILAPVPTTDPMGDFLWVITLERGTNTPAGDPVWLCRALMCPFDDSLAVAWVFGVASPVLLSFSAAALLIGVRPLRRKERGHCPYCNYDLKFDTARPCPECGWRSSTGSG